MSIFEGWEIEELYSEGQISTDVFTKIFYVIVAF